jgi:hypothetical protein
MAFYEEVTENYETTEVIYEEEWEVTNYLAEDDGDGDFDDYRLAEYALWDLGNDMIPDSWVVLPYLCGPRDALAGLGFPVELVDYYGNDYSLNVTEPWWDYDVYFDAFSAMDELGEENFLEYTGCSYEAITVDFSIRDVECSADMCIGCMAGCDQMGLFWYEPEGDGEIDNDEIFTFAELIEMVVSDWDNVKGVSNLEDCQTYPNVYPRQYWGSPSQSEGICDPVGGIQYRTIVDGLVDPHYLEPIEWWGIVGPASEAYGVCDENWPIPVPLYCNPCDVYFLGKNYDALSFGTDEDGYDYMFYGTPEWYVEEKVKVGETSQEYGEGWTVTVNDLGIYENKAHVTITNPDGESYDYLVVIDTYTSQVPSPGEGDWGDGGYDYDDDGNEENDCLIFVEDTFNIYSLCGAEEEGTMEIDGEAVFAVDFTKTMIGAAGTYVIEYDAYALKDYGVLREQIYPGACDPSIDPAIKVGDLEWFFDIIPNNGVQPVDLDNDVALWAEGNPNFDGCDNLSIYSPFDAYDFADMLEDIGVISDTPGGTPDFDDLDDALAWDAALTYLSTYYQVVGVTLTYGTDNGDKSIDTLDFVVDDGQTTGPASELGNYPVIPLCAPMLELWLATPVELAGLCDEELSITLEDCEGNNYFTLTVTDSIHTDYEIDGSIELSRTEMVGETITTHYVDLEPEALVKLDENITTEMKQEYNLVLIGGPVANTIVQELVDLGKTTFEKWDTSEGELELIADAFADGKHVLIVAGKDRDATTMAALDLVNAL